MRIDETTISNFEQFVYNSLCFKLGIHYSLEQSVKNLECLHNGKRSYEGNINDFSNNYEIDILCGKDGYYVGVEVQSQYHQNANAFNRDIKKHDKCFSYGIPLLFIYNGKDIDEDTRMAYQHYNMEIYTSTTKLAERIKELLENPIDGMRKISGEERMQYDSDRMWKELKDRQRYDSEFQGRMRELHKDYKQQKKDKKRRERDIAKQKKQEVEYSWLDHKWNFPSNDDIDVQRKIDSMPLGDAIKEGKIRIDGEDINWMITEVIRKIKNSL